ncbi:flavin reductase family protein [Cobetia crustatorum]|uniref:flavin reductase family protein n=1 Tax=Cobetia crustatorum TaxID=553385 RepID=UPI001C9789DE|nr:flavin reductase [Cobetia crustatorum]
MSLPDANSDTIIEPARFREALGHFASGITTTQVDDEPIGFTCQSFYSVSINPPLVSFSYPKFHQTERFAANTLSS